MEKYNVSKFNIGKEDLEKSYNNFQKKIDELIMAFIKLKSQRGEKKTAFYLCGMRKHIKDAMFIFINFSSKYVDTHGYRPSKWVEFSNLDTESIISQFNTDLRDLDCELNQLYIIVNRLEDKGELYAAECTILSAAMSIALATISILTPE